MLTSPLPLPLAARAWLPRAGWRRWAPPLAVGAAGLLLLGLFRQFALDDAYITYRVAAHLAAGAGPVYNLGEPTLTTTAPGYALLLAALDRLLGHLPQIGLAISILALAVGALLLADLGAGAAGAALLLLSPLLLDTLGMETNTQVALVLLALWLARRDRPMGMALALAGATLARPDGVIAALPVAIAYLAWQRRVPWRALPGGLLPVAALYGWLWLTFGSPLPDTLAAKQAQLALGFYGYLAGIPVWLAQFAQAPGAAPLAATPAALRAFYAAHPLLLALPALMLPAFIVGFVASWRRRERWNLALLAWAALHSAAYVALGVAGYHWYYAPLAVAVASTAGLGVQQLVLLAHAAALRKRLRLSALWGGGAALLLLLALAPELLGSAVLQRSLPEARATLYRQAGAWLARETPPGSTVGVMEVGIMGYTSGRTMIDFAGLTRPETAAALARGDVFWSIAQYQPDYLVLSNADPLYSFDLQDDPWFQAAYRPVTGFRDAGWWGSPLTIFQRRTAAPDAPVSDAVGARYGDVARLDRYALDRTVAQPGQFIHLTATWTRLPAPPPGGHWKLFAHLIDDKYKVYSGNDVVVYPERWPSGVPITTHQFLAVPKDLAPGRYYVELGWYEPATLRRLPVTNAAGKPAGETVVLHPVQVERP